MQEHDRALLRAGAAILAVAFLIKAPIGPLNAWLLPGYTSTSAPVAALLKPVVLAITVAVTTVLLARVSLFRQRAADADRSVATTVQPRTVTHADRHSG